MKRLFRLKPKKGKSSSNHNQSHPVIGEEAQINVVPSTPLITAGSTEESENMSFLWPLGLAIDSDTKRIYIPDEPSNRVQVLDSDANYLFSFPGNNSYKLLNPDRITINNGITYVVSHSTSLLSFLTLDGDLLSQVNLKNFPEGINGPTSIAINSSGILYICEWNKGRVAYINPDTGNLHTFTDRLTSPQDIKISNNQIITLDRENHCSIKFFNMEGELMNTIIPNPTTSLALFFAIDQYQNILLSNWNQNSIDVYNSDGTLLKRFSDANGHFSKPAGIEIDQHSRIVTICHEKENCIKIFDKLSL